jgi:transcriptional regulator with XRE-family HTH domain
MRSAGIRFLTTGDSATSGCGKANGGWWKKRGPGITLPLRKEEHKMSFGKNLQTLRKKNQLSQEGLADMLGVSRQAVSKWELGEGYPEVDKLLILSKKLNVSLDSLLGEENTPIASESSKTSDIIRIISPNEGVIVSTSKITRSQQFKGGRNSPRYALYAWEGSNTTFSQNTFLAWYRNLDDITKEIEEITNALNAGAASYTLQYSVKCKQDLFRTIEE